MSKVVVYHSYYGCDTGCCGHIVELGGKEEFFFNHPWGEDFREWAERLVRDAFGADHVSDLDWDNCVVLED